MGYNTNQKQKDIRISPSKSIDMGGMIMGYGGIPINYTLSMRDKLPALVPEKQSYSIWAILKEAIGKDLSRITMPIFLNEPLSML